MSEQVRSNAQEASAAPGISSGITHPHADQLHGSLLVDFKSSLVNHPDGVFDRWGYTWLHSMTDEDAMSEREALGFAPVDALDYYNHGCLLALREDYTAAARAFAKARELDPKSLEAQFNHALALSHASQPNEAREAWKAFLAAHPDLPEEDARQIKDWLAALADA